MWNTKPPLLVWIMAASMKLFGIHEFAVRLPSALAGLGTVVLLLLFCTYALSDLRAGLYAAFALMTTVGFIGEHVARSGDYDALLVFWIAVYSLGYFQYLESAEGPRKSLYLAITTIAVTVAVLTKGIAGLMCMPGLLLYTLLQRRLRELLSSPRVYLAACVITTLSVGYYVLRELHNPGYIQAVIDGELLTHSNVTEDHAGDFLFYVRDVFRFKFVPWAYILPLCFLVILCDAQRIRRFGLFAFLYLSCYFFVITSAKTKLPWYDVPLYPLSALVIGIGLSKTLQGLKLRLARIDWLRERESSIVLFVALFSLPLVDTAYSRIYLRSGILYSWSVGSDGPLGYGDYLELILRDRPALRELRIINDGYNSHLVFYVKAANLANYSVEIADSSADLPTDRPLVTCIESVRERLAAIPDARVIHSYRSCATFVWDLGEGQR
jgi:4-amino-4-deoxy-L-arabinose transferase-like glycosyltransferase